MQANREQRAGEQDVPPALVGVAGLNVVFIQAMAMVMQMRDLHGMHAAKHQEAEGGQDQILGAARDSQGHSAGRCGIGEVR